MPASVVLKNRPWRTGVAGTIWNGEVGVAGGSTVEWHFAPLRSLVALGFAVDWRATGPDTDLGGQAIVRPGRVVLDRVSGSADATLLRAVAPALPFTCDLTMQVELPRAVLAGDGAMADGTVLADAGTCRANGDGVAVPVPATILSAQHIGTQTRIRLAPQAQRRRVLVDAALGEDGTARFTVTPDGAAVLPFAGMPPGIAVETRF